MIVEKDVGKYYLRDGMVLYQCVGYHAQPTVIMARVSDKRKVIMGCTSRITEEFDELGIVDLPTKGRTDDG